MNPDKKKKHICHLVYSFDVGGLERIIVNCVNNLDKEKFRHTIISLTHIGEFTSEVEKNVGFFSLNKKEGNDIAAFFRLYKLLRKLRPDVLHTYNLGTIEFQWVAFLARVPLRVHAEHGRDTYDPNGSVRKYQLIRKICSFAIHRIVAVSGDLMNWLTDEVKIPKQKLRLIVNGVDTYYYQQNEKSVIQEARFENKFIFGHVARLHGIKNQLFMLHCFLAACEQSNEFYKNSVLLLVGDGPDREKLTEFISKNELLHDRVYLEGSRTNVRDYYEIFDVFLMSSIAEGIPMTLLESMSMSVPHLVTYVGGIKEVVVDKVTGFAVEPDDDVAYTNGLLDLFNDRELTRKMSANVRSQVADEFSQDKMMSGYSDIYLGRK